MPTELLYRRHQAGQCVFALRQHAVASLSQDLCCSPGQVGVLLIHELCDLPSKMQLERMPKS